MSFMQKDEFSNFKIQFRKVHPYGVQRLVEPKTFRKRPFRAPLV